MLWTIRAVDLQDLVTTWSYDPLFKPDIVFLSNIKSNIFTAIL